MAFQLMETDGYEESWKIGDSQPDKRSVYKQLLKYKYDQWQDEVEDVKIIFKKTEPDVYDWYVHRQAERQFYIKQV